MMTCKIEGCNGKYEAKGYCRMHYLRFKRHGDASVTLVSRDHAKTFQDSIMPIPECGCWIWMGSTRKPCSYGRLRVDSISTQTHRYSWEIHNGPIPDGKWVLHKCDTPLCVNPHHLYIGTHKDNMRDKVKRGRTMLKVSKEDATQMLDLNRYGFTQKEISRMYKVGKSTTSWHIVNAKKFNNN